MNKSNNIQPILRSKKEAKHSYNIMSNWYNMFSIFEKKYRELGIEKLNVQTGEQILEVGFGTGTSIVKFVKESNYECTVFGIDLSDRMCSKTKKLLLKKKIDSFSHICCGDATDLPFNSEMVNALFLSFTLELFSKQDMKKVLEECFRVLVKGGRVGIVALSRRKVTPMLKLYEWFHNKWPKMIDCRPILPEKELINSNFSIESISTKKMWGIPVDIIIAKK